MDTEPLASSGKECLTYRSYLFLLRIAEYGSNVLNVNKKFVLEKLIRAFKDLQLNEVEISLLNIYLERFGWNSADSNTINVDFIILFSAYAAKCFLNQNTSEFESKMMKKYPNFNEYPKWICRYRNSLVVGYVELNYAYAQLSSADITVEEVDCFDYNLAVTQLIENSARPEKTENL